MRAAAVQLESTKDTDQNLAAAERLVRGAAADGAELVVLPERLDIRGAAADYAAGAEPLDGRPVTWARELAASSASTRRRLGRGAPRGPRAVSNTSVHAGPDGELQAVYRKIHMFDVEVGGQVYRESEHSEAGGEIVAVGDGERRPARADRLLRPPLPGAVPRARPARRSHRAPSPPNFTG